MRKVQRTLFILLVVAADIHFANAQQPQFNLQIDETKPTGREPVCDYHYPMISSKRMVAK